MKILRESIGHLVNWLHHGRKFSLAGYSDAEWNCVLGNRVGETTGLGQVINVAHGKRLLDVLRRRQADERFVFAVPECLWPCELEDDDGVKRFFPGLPGFAEGQIDWFLGSQGIQIEALERDRLTDDAARRAQLFPFINRLRQMRVGVIGPKELCGLADVVRQRRMVAISTPNLHLEDGGIETAVDKALSPTGRRVDVWLVSAGVSAAIIVDMLHDKIDGWAIDCGSIWDAFVGIGGQRAWRAELYADPAKLAEWKRKNTEPTLREKSS